MSVSVQHRRFWLVGILWAAQLTAQDFTISTFAGGAPPRTPVAGTIASIGWPRGIAADAAGNVYFSTHIHCVFKLDTAGILTLVAGNSRWGYSGDGGPATVAQLRDPNGVALDGGGNLYIADSSNHSVRRVSASGIITTVAGSGTAGFSGDDGPAASAQLSNPTGVAVDGAGVLYIADAGNNRIRRVSPAGIITTAPGTAGPPGQVYLLSIAVDAAGDLYIADSDGTSVRRVSPSGAVTTVADQLQTPTGVAVNAAGMLYVAEASNHRILRQIGPAIFTPVAGTGEQGFSGDGGIATSARLNGPRGVAVDGAGNVYIADNGNCRIRRALSGSGMTYTGTISTVAGNGSANYSGDGGPAASAQISPRGVGSDAAGNIYVADIGNDRVRRVSPAGIITTVAGTGDSGYSGDNGPATSAWLERPVAVVSDATGNLYIAEFGNHRIRRVSPAGIITTLAGTGTWGRSGDGGPANQAELAHPTGVALDAAGTLYISEWGTSRLRRVSPSGIIDTVAGAQLNGPRGVAVDQDGNAYVADTENHRVLRVSAAGAVITVAGNGVEGFSGDGGPATSAQLSRPFNVVVDSAGALYISDGGNNRIRRVSSPSLFGQRTISTIAGDGTDQYSGDGGPATSAQVSRPSSLGLDSAGRVYVATANAVRVLTPVCTASATPNAFDAPVGGAALTLTIQAAAGCAWTIAGLPAWITASATSGSGPATVTLTVAANSGAARSATITAAGTSVTVSQAAGGVVCTYAISSAGQRFPRTGGTGTFTVSTAAGCGWTAVSAASWITITSGAAGSGEGAVNYQVLANSTGAPRSSAITAAGLTFTVEQLGPGVVVAGSMPQVASGGRWKTTFTLVNNGSEAATARLTFRGADGAELPLPLTFPQTSAGPVLAGVLERVLGPGAILIVESEGPAAEPVKQGWAELSTDGAVTGFAVFCQSGGETEPEAVVPLETRSAAAYLLAFDNTGGVVTGVAIANAAAHAGTVSVVINDDTGAEIQTSPLNLAAYGHMAFELNSRYPATAGRRGTVEFRRPAGGQVGVIGLRFNPKVSFTTVPVIAK